jgi:hypothetical protein
MKTLHTLVAEALRAHTTTADRYSYVDYYLDMCIEISAEMEQQDILAAEAMAQNPFSFFDDDLPF